MFRLTLLLLVLAFIPSLAKADAALEEGIDRLAAKVAAYAKGEGHSSIIVGDFTAPPLLKASSGAGLSHLLATSLKKAGLDVSDKATLQLVGDFKTQKEKDFKDAAFDSVVLRITGKVLDTNGEELKSFPISIFGDAAAKIVGGNVEIPTRADVKDEEREAETKRRLDSPQASLVGPETRASKDSPYGIEVVIKDKSRVPQLVNGRSFVPLQKTEEYVVRLHTRSAYEAAVELTIDGLSVFAFSEEGNFGARFLIPPGRSIDIPGWYFTTRDSRAFVITSYPDSAAGKKGVRTSIGTITASYSAAWSVGAPRPADEPALPPGGKDSDNATGIGRPIEKRYESVERIIGQTRAIISVRYNR